MPQYEDCLTPLQEKWKDNQAVFSLAGSLAIACKKMNKLRNSKETEERKTFRLLWQKASSLYWDLVWAITEAKIDAQDKNPPERLEFDPFERLIIDYGYLNAKGTQPNPFFEKQLDESSAVDMYEYNHMTDYLSESYALLFGKPYEGPARGVSLKEKLERFSKELAVTQQRRRMALGMLFGKSALVSPPDLESIVKRLDEGLQDRIELEMRTKRVREADGAERERIGESAKQFDRAETELFSLLDKLEASLTASEEADEPEEDDEDPLLADEPEDETDLDDLLLDDDDEDGDAEAKNPPDEPEPKEPKPAPQAAQPATTTVEKTEKGAANGANAELDQMHKVAGNVLALHDRAKFLVSLMVHVGNESVRRETRIENMKKKFKGAGVPALKMELREGFNRKKEFLLVASRSARVDVSPLNLSKDEPVSTKRAGEIMMDLTALDPGMLLASRIRMYGIPRVILIPGQGWGVYDWTDNSLLIPITAPASDVKSFCFALGNFRWDNDEDRTLKDTYSTLKQNRDKGIRALQESFCNDYFIWLSKERKGYRVLKRDVYKWFTMFFKVKAKDAPTKGAR